MKANEDESEVIGAYSYSLVPWKNEGMDAITWSLAVNREDFTFRTNMFEGFPEVEYKETFKLKKGEWYTVEVFISKEYISYSVNGMTYAYAYGLESGEIVEKGQIGMVSAGTKWSYRNFEQWPYKWECPVCGPEQKWDPVMYHCTCPEGTQNDWMDWTKCMPTCEGNMYWEHKYDQCVMWCPSGEEHEQDENGNVSCKPIVCPVGQAYDPWYWECKPCNAGS